MDKASSTRKQLVALTANGKGIDHRELIKLRSQFQRDMLAIAQLAREDHGLKAKPELFSEFRDKHNAACTDLSQHQAQWMMHNIDKDRAGYEADTDKLRQSHNEFFKWAAKVI